MFVKQCKEETKERTDGWVGKQRENKSCYVIGKQDPDYPVGAACVPVLS